MTRQETYLRMRRNCSWIALAALFAASAVIAAAQVKNYTPVTDAMLLNPPPEDWLMFSRTYDAQRYSPLFFELSGTIDARLQWCVSS